MRREQPLHPASTASTARPRAQSRRVVGMDSTAPPPRRALRPIGTPEHSPGLSVLRSPTPKKPSSLPHGLRAIKVRARTKERPSEGSFLVSCFQFLAARPGVRVIQRFSGQGRTEVGSAHAESNLRAAIRRPTFDPAHRPADNALGIGIARATRRGRTISHAWLAGPQSCEFAGSDSHQGGRENGFSQQKKS